MIDRSRTVECHICAFSCYNLVADTEDFMIYKEPQILSAGAIDHDLKGNNPKGIDEIK